MIQILRAYTAELFALSKALQLSTTLTYNKYIIYSNAKAATFDVQKAIKIGEGSDITNEIIFEIIGNNREIVIQWVPWHIGIKHNDFMDRLACEATLSMRCVNS